MVRGSAQEREDYCSFIARVVWSFVFLILAVNGVWAEIDGLVGV